MAKQGKQQTPSSSAPAADVCDFSSASATTGSSSLDLADHFLIAMPSMLDPVFGGTVVYICEHNAGGALGVIINRPTDLTTDMLFERLDLSLEINLHSGSMPSDPVMFGGPVQVERGFVLHGPASEYSSSLTVSNEIGRAHV